MSFRPDAFLPVSLLARITDIRVSEPDRALQAAKRRQRRKQLTLDGKLNVLGAGDAFASGLIYGVLHGWDWQKSARMGNACGAIVVTRQGCANFMPYETEALQFIEERGGF